MDTVKEQEKAIDRLLSEGNQDEAVKALFDLIVEYAKKKDFIRAEALRDKLFEAAPMALSEISKSGDIIDEEKNSAIDETHRKIWADLYTSLSPEEANELYFAMKENKYKQGETVFSVGDESFSLCFLDAGEARMVYTKGDEEILKILESGDIAGEDTFFYETAVRTVSLVANKDLKLRSIERKMQDRWKDKFPALEQKLHKYCDKKGRITEIITKKGFNRRNNKRVKIKGKVTVQLLNNSGAPTGNKFVGLLADISISGLAFTIKLSNNDVAHKILGSKTKTQLAVKAGDSSRTLEQTGKIVGIGYHVLSDHSIHIRFDQPDEIIKKIISR